MKKYILSSLAAVLSVAIIAGCAPGAYAAGPASGIVDKLYVPAGAGGTARTSAAKFAENVSVTDYGAKCNGVADDTTAFNNAINASRRVLVPAGTCLLTTVTLKANTTLLGMGEATILKQTGAGALGMLWVDSGSASVASNVSGIVIRDMQLRGAVDTTGFSEHVYLVSLNGVSNVVIERVSFRGFQGDGLYLGSSQTGATERHNVNVTVRNCVFDGINKQNRNAISVIDGDGVTIDGNVFTNTTRPDMPGAIDIEPDGFAYHVVQNIRITKNKFKTIGGTGGAVTIFRAGGAALIRNVLVEANDIDGVDNAGVGIMDGGAAAVVASDPDALFIVRGNTIKNTKYPFTLQGVKNALVEKNLIEASTNDAQIGYYSYNYQTVMDVTVADNTFKGCGTAGQVALSVFKADRVRIVRNTFNDCGNSLAGSSAIDLGIASASTNVEIEKNVFIQGGNMLKAITKQGSHVDSPSTRIVRGNVFNSLANDLPAPTAAQNSAENYTLQSFTPAAKGSTVAGTATYSLQKGSYTQIGNRVFFDIALTWTGHTGTGTLTVALPVAQAGVQTNTAVEVWSENIAVAAGQTIKGQVPAGANYVQILLMSSGAVATVAMPAAGTLMLSGHYSVQ